MNKTSVSCAFFTTISSGQKHGTCNAKQKNIKIIFLWYVRCRPGHFSAGFSCRQRARNSRWWTRTGDIPSPAPRATARSSTSATAPNYSNDSSECSLKICDKTPVPLWADCSLGVCIPREKKMQQNALAVYDTSVHRAQGYGRHENCHSCSRGLRTTCGVVQGESHNHVVGVCTSLSPTSRAGYRGIYTSKRRQGDLLRSLPSRNIIFGSKS